MNRGIIFIFLFYLSACKAQQPVAAKSETKSEAIKTETRVLKSEPPATPQKKGAYIFFLLLPVDLASAIVQDSIEADSFYISENIGKEVRSSVDFYEGSLAAIDSLRRAGANIMLKVIDMESSDEQQLSAIWKINFEKCDAVFSMLRGKPLKTLNGILLSKNIPLISCAPNSGPQLEKNKDAFCVQPSSLVQCRLMGEYAGMNFKGDNMVIVQSSLEKEQERAHAFQEGVEKNNAGVKIKKVNLVLEGRKGLSNAIEAGKINTLFVPSADEDFVTTVYSFLDSSLSIYRYRVIGLPVWQYFESLDPQVMEKFNTNIFSPDQINFSSPAAVRFRERFRTMFGTEPADGAFLAYDTFLQFGNLIAKDEIAKDKIEFTGLRSEYFFSKSDERSARENHRVFILKLEDFRYVRVNPN